MPRIVADLHTHSLASTHAYSTVGELMGVAAAKGLRAIALTDHGPALPDAPHPWHFDNQRVLPREVDGVKLLRGSEVNIRTLSGDVDLDERLLGLMDWVVASFHEPCLAPGTAAEHTAAYLAVLAHPGVDSLGHTGSIQFPYEIDTVVKACRDAGKTMEINAGSFKVRPRSLPNCRRIAESCAKHGTLVVVTSDAHSHWDVGAFGPALALLDELGFPGELIVNADEDRLFRYLEARRGRSLR
jgi:putative hydrolase